MQRRALVLGVLLLLGAGAWAQEATAKKAKATTKGAAAKAAATPGVSGGTSNIVPSAGETMLTNDIGDVLPKGEPATLHG